LDLYFEGIPIPALFSLGVLGFQTHRDAFAISLDKFELEKRISDMRNVEISDEALAKSHSVFSNRDWKISTARQLARKQTTASIIKCGYRPFDDRWAILSEVAMDYPRLEFNSHIVNKDNLTLTIPRQIAVTGYHHVFSTKLAAESCLISNKTKEGNVNFPLYQFEDLDQTRRVNMDPKIRQQIEDKAEHPTLGRPDEVAIFDYIYGVLHCPAYRSTYAEFLKIDFPRVPWPTSPDAFWDISAKGTALRRLHLMEDAAIGPTPYKFTGEGDSVVDKPIYAHGHVFINKTQCFEDVPAVAWTFFIGGYQPAQKWLKDRKGRTLSFEDIKHYQKIIKILTQTDAIMATIEMDL
jgi:predicted helicase